MGQTQCLWLEGTATLTEASFFQARELGATDTINYKENPDWEKEVLRLTNNVGVDHVIEVCKFSYHSRFLTV